MRAKEILERLCQQGDDVWQTQMLGLRALCTEQLQEAWSALQKAGIVKQMAMRGGRLLDHVVLNDFDMTLWSIPIDKEFDPSGVINAVSINSEEHDPTDPETQHIKFPGSSLRHLPISSMMEVLNHWVKDYGRLVIGSVNLKKLNIYRKICQRHGFKITNLDQGRPEAGFFVEDTDQVKAGLLTEIRPYINRDKMKCHVCGDEDPHEHPRFKCQCGWYGLAEGAHLHHCQ